MPRTSSRWRALSANPLRASSLARASLSAGTAAVAAAVVLSVVAATSPATAQAPLQAARTLTSCPVGQVRETGVPLADFAAGATSSCSPALKPETVKELAAAQGQAATRNEAPFGVQAGALAAGVESAQALAASGTKTTATWQPYGRTPLIANGASYGEVNKQGFVNLAGRVEDFAAVPGVAGRWFASVANGGIWETNDAGAHWRSIGDNLPTQITGTVAYLAGRVLVGTGDPAFGGSSLSGMGAFYSDNDGATWLRSSGVPSGALSFQLAVDGSDASKVYLATSKGLYRSTDRGASFTRMVLPTGCTSLTDENCFFANIVTDVVVQGKGTGTPGAVLAAVGWRAGQKLNTVGKMQAPQNGLYSSVNGTDYTYIDPGATSVPNVATTGFPATRSIGRVALGIAAGPTQDHRYVYAVVQDAGKFNGSTCALDVNDNSLAGATCGAGTYLNGVFGSSDFGKHWTKLADGDSLKSPLTQSALLGAGTASYSPGVQSWYNEWIQPDPSPTLTAASGAPQHLAFGLEEVWQNTMAEQATSANLSPIVIASSGSPVLAPQLTQFQVVGRYYGGGTCYGLKATLPVPCTTNLAHSGSTTTHPDQHAGLFVPDLTGGGTTLLIGNDGGVYAQHAASGTVVTQDGWGDGAQGTGTGIMNTLLPYDAQMAKDGTVYAGLQDNGQMRINADGSQYEVYGGDAFFSPVDPDNSNIAYEEYTNGAVAVTIDGGKTWSSIKPALTAALFSTPLVMDSQDAKHLLVGGRQIMATTAGPLTNQSTNGTSVDPATAWQKLFDLGTRLEPGVAAATANVTDPNNGNPNNSTSALDVFGSFAYAGYCGACDIVTGTRPFASGIATNVVKAAGKPAVAGAWHIAKAQGLPQRYVNAVYLDRGEPGTVYAAIGGYGRRWIPPGALKDDLSKVGTGHLFVSRDAGEHFTDVSGNLPDLPANTVLRFEDSLLVGTDAGVFSTSAARPGTFSLFAKGLPNVPVFHLAASPRSTHEVIAASYGRGVYTLVTQRPVAARTETVSLVPTSLTAGLASTGLAVTSLAATGLPTGLALAGTLLLLVGLVLRRRQTV